MLDQVRVLAACYRGAVKAIFRKNSRLLLRGDPRKNEERYARFEKFAAAVAEAEIPPGSWCLFSCDAWRFLSITKHPPSTKWLFSCKRLETQLEWYELEKARWTGRRNIVTQMHLELLVDWRAMWAELLRAHPQDRAGVLDIVEKHFPGEAYEYRVTRARGDVVYRQSLADRDIAAGRIMWATT